MDERMNRLILSISLDIAVFLLRGISLSPAGRKDFVSARSLPDFRRLLLRRPHVRSLAAEEDLGGFWNIEGEERSMMTRGCRERSWGSWGY